MYYTSHRTVVPLDFCVAANAYNRVVQRTRKKGRDHGKHHHRRHPGTQEQLLFDDERCFSYNSDELARACSGLKVKLVYAASLLLMVGGLTLATLL